MKKLLSLIFGLSLIILFSYSVFGIVLTGTVYDSSLNKVSKAIVEIQPHFQRDITEQGVYSFEIPSGEYNITVIYVQNGKKEIASEHISVDNSLEYYNLDLFLFEDITEEEGLNNLPEINVDSVIKEKSNYIYLLIIIPISIFVGLLFFIKYKKNQFSIKANSGLKKIVLTSPVEQKGVVMESFKEFTPQTSKYIVIDILKKNDGSMTQKDLRKNIPYSEAKVSLWITELESDGKIRKIRKGRGNIIILK